MEGKDVERQRGRTAQRKGSRWAGSSGVAEPGRGKGSGRDQGQFPTITTPTTPLNALHQHTPSIKAILIRRESRPTHPGNMTEKAWEPPEVPTTNSPSSFCDAGLLGAQCYKLAPLACILRKILVTTNGPFWVLQPVDLKAQVRTSQEWRKL